MVDRTAVTQRSSECDRRANTDDRPAEDRCADGRPADAHLEAVPDGAGCTEIWEHLSERRAAESDERDD